MAWFDQIQINGFWEKKSLVKTISPLGQIEMSGFDVCNNSDQYVKFKELVDKLDDSSFWDLIKCTPRCKFTKYILKPMVESNYNDLLYKTGKSDGANLAVIKFDMLKNSHARKFQIF